MPPWIVPAMQAIVSAPIAQCEIVSAIRSQSSDDRSDSPPGRIEASALFRRGASVMKKSATKISVKIARPTENSSPARPSADDTASGTLEAIG